MEDDHSSHVRVEPDEAAFELVTVGDRRQVVGGPRRVEGNQRDIDPVAPQPAGLVDAGTNEQAMQPGIEASRVPQRGQITPGPDQRVLDGVGGLLRIPKDEPGGGIQPGDRGACQLGEGVMIASPRSLHEVSLHLAPRRWRDRGGHAR